MRLSSVSLHFETCKAQENEGGISDDARERRARGKAKNKRTFGWHWTFAGSNPMTWRAVREVARERAT